MSLIHRAAAVALVLALAAPVAAQADTYTLANFSGVDPATGKYVYSLPTDKNGNYQPQALAFYDGGFYDPSRVVSRWSVMVTLRYKF